MTAIKNPISDKKQIIYIAHPIGGDVEENIKKVLDIVRVLSANQNIVPFAPYIVDVMALDDRNPQERAIGFDHNKALFQTGIIDEVWLFGDRISAGMATEIAWARRLNIPVIPKTEGTAKC
ncbi:hypothetical protein D9M68_624830 [compost metagenome]